MEESILNQATSRTTEFVLGLIGGIFGIFVGVFVIMFGELGRGFSGSSGGLTSSGIAVIILATLGIIGAAMVKSKPKIAGVLMLVAAIGGFIASFVFYILPAILLLIAGLMSLIRK